MSLTLGLDLGVNSIGWALFDEDKQQFTKAGVRVYEDIDPISANTQSSPNIERRMFRSRRRQLKRKKFRKLLLYKKLIEKGIISSDDFDSFNKFVNAIKSLNPYQLRYEGLNRKLSILEFCRILFHFSQRRGFLSNRKQIANIKADERSKIKLSIKALEENLSDKTLGQFLFELYPQQYNAYEYKERIRQRFTSRKMYADELKKIWFEQAKYYPEILSEENYQYFGDFKKGIIFYQHPLKSPKKLVGKCTFEKNKPRCPKSRYEFQEFAFLQVLNNITITFNSGETRTLDDSEKDKILKLALNKKLTKKSYECSLTIKEVIKYLKLTNGTLNYELDYTLPPITFMSFVHWMFPQNYINKYFQDKFYEKIEDLWELLNFFSDEDKLIETLKKEKHFPEDDELGFHYDAEKIKIIENYHHVDGYSSLSLKAIKKILPYLKSGYKYHIATILAGVANVFGKDFAKLSEDQIKYIEENIINIYNNNKTNTYKPDLVKDFLVKNFNVTNDQLKKLYVHSDTKTEFQILQTLPRFDLNIRNPKVSRSLNEVRKIVNVLLQRVFKLDKIVVEISTELKKSKKELINLKRNQIRNRNANEKARLYLTETLGITNPTKEMIEKYRLYLELINKSDKETNNNFVAMCPYTGKIITEENLFTDGEFDVDHIIPFSRCFNDSLNNKIICDADFNRNIKGNKTPFETFSQQKTSEWDFIKQRARKILNKDKYLRFIAENIPEESEFATNKLNDTRYIAKIAADYLKQIGAQVQVVSGSVTGITRQNWGLNTILNDLNKDIINTKDDNQDLNIKNRADHRHHAVDAMILCLITPKIIKDISTLKTRKKILKEQRTLPYPWKTMKFDIQKIIETMVVSIKQKNKITSISSKYIIVRGRKVKVKTFSPRGKLHNETFYGLRTNPETKSNVFVHRIPIQNIDTLKKVDKIMDGSIKNLIKKYLHKNNLIDKDGKVSKGAFIHTTSDGKVLYELQLPNKRGKPIPIKKARVFEESSNKRQIPNSNNKWVEPGNNHHAEIYKNSKGKYYQILVPFWDAVDRVKNKVPVYRDPNTSDELITFVQQNDIFALGIPDDIEFNTIKNINTYLYRVQKISFSGKLELPNYIFRHQLASTINFDKQMIRVVSFDKFISLNPYKVYINNLGEIIKFVKINF